MPRESTDCRDRDFAEWSFHRSACPACNERDPRKLPTFESTLHPAARIEPGLAGF